MPQTIRPYWSFPRTKLKKPEETNCRCRKPYRICKKILKKNLKNKKKQRIKKSALPSYPSSPVFQDPSKRNRRKTYKVSKKY